MEILSIIYLVMIFVSLYVSFLFLILFFKNKKSMFKDEFAKELPLLSVLIPAHNEEDSIAQTIKFIQESNYPKEKLEIIAIDDGSKDNTLKILKQIQGIKIISKTNSGKSDSLNKAIKQAKGEFIAVIDADSYIQKDSFQNMLSYFKDEKVGAVTGAVLVKDPKKLIERLQAIEYTVIAWARKLMEFIGSVYATTGPLSIYRKKVLEEVGGFDVKAWTEDVDITWNILRHGYKTKMCLSAQTYTVVPNSLKKWWKQRNRWNVGGLQVCNKYKGTFLKKKYGPLGYFVLPFFICFYILSLTGFSIYIYLLVKSILKSFLIVRNANTANLPLTEAVSFSLAPTVFTVFLGLMLLISLIYSLIALKTITKKMNVSLKYGFYLLFYLLFYFILNPIVLVHSIYKIMTHNVTW